MRPSRLLLPVIILLSSSISHVNAEVIAKPSHDPKIEQEVKRYAVPSLVNLLKKADAEGRVIPLESFSLTEPHRLLDAEIMSRPAGHVHPALLDERYYAVTEDRESQKDLSYMEELEDGLYYVILDSESRRPQFALCFQIWDSEWLYHYEYDDLGNLREVRSYAVELPLETSLRTYPNLREEYHYSELNKQSIFYRRFSHSGWTRGNIDYPYETEFRSHDGGRTMDLTVYPALESSRRSERPCISYRTVDGSDVSAKLSGEPHCIQFHGSTFKGHLIRNVDSRLEISIAGEDILFYDFQRFLSYRFPDVAVQALTIEFLEFRNDLATRIRVSQNGHFLFEYRSDGFENLESGGGIAWQMTFPDAQLTVNEERYQAESLWPEYCEAMLFFNNRMQKRKLTKEAMEVVRQDSYRRKPVIESLHPLILLYLADRLKQAEQVPVKRRTVSVSATDIGSLQKSVYSAKPGDTIVLQSGIYDLKRPLRIIDKRHLTLLAERDVEMRTDDANISVIEVLRSDHVRIEGFRLLKKKDVGRMEPIVTIKDSRFVTLQNLSVVGPASHSLALHHSQDIVLQYSHLSGSTVSAIGIGSMLKNVMVRYNRFEGHQRILNRPLRFGVDGFDFYGNSGDALIRLRCVRWGSAKQGGFRSCGRYQ